MARPDASPDPRPGARPDRSDGSDRLVRVGLLWHSVNSSNLGVGALTAAHIAMIEKISAEIGCRVELYVIGWVDDGPFYIENANVRVVPVRFRDLFNVRGKVHGALKRCDLVCDIGAGDSFADIYGLRRFISVSLAKMAVPRPRRRLVLSPQTIGPFDRWWTRALARWLMTRCRAVVVRDHLSLSVLCDMKIKANVIEATDVAFRLPYRPADRPADRPENRPENRPADGNGDDGINIGINISGLLFNGGYTRRNMFNLVVDYPRLARSLLQWFDRQPGCRVHLISHVISETAPVEDDYRIARQLAAEFPRMIVAPRFASPSDAKSYISGMDFFCGSRMHACIAAFSSGVPTVPISYSRKFTGLFDSLEYPMVADCKAEPEDQILEKVRSGFHRRETLKAMVEASVARAGEKLLGYEALLETCLREIGSGNHEIGGP
jgi:colanic acid/amylovoran biosynthesis protein